MQGRVLAGEQGRPAGQAGRRAGVVPVELERPMAEDPGRQVLPAEGGDGLGLVGGWVSLLVGHHHEDVGRGHGAAR